MHNLPSHIRCMAICNGQLQPESRPMPVPQPGEVLVRVAYAGINRADLFQKQGSYPAPEDGSDLPGLEVSGHVVALGAGVEGWPLATPVCGLTNGGGYAAYAAIPAAQLLPVPPGLSMAEAACLPEACATAAMALLQEGMLRPGERVLIHGGASGIGILLVQCARVMGATVFATASESKHTALQALGVTPLHYSPDFAAQTQARIGDGLDLILDTIGGPYLAPHIKLLRKGGRLVTIACLEGGKGELSMGAMLMKHLRISGITLRGQSSENKKKIIESTRKTLWPHVASGAIRPLIDTVFPLEEAEKAFVRMENRLNLGKMVLEVQDA